jgi:hypothetical protein
MLKYENLLKKFKLNKKIGFEFLKKKLKKLKKKIRESKKKK